MTAPTKLRFGARVQFHAHGALDLDGVAIRTPCVYCGTHCSISDEELLPARPFPYGYVSMASVATNYVATKVAVRFDIHGSVRAPLACSPEAT